MGEQTLRIAVIGAGIGGLTAAMALRRAGMQVAVYEQAPVLREVGAGMHLAPNGTRLLHRFGLAGQLREVAVRPETLQVRLWNSGTVVARQPMGAAWESQFGAPHYTLHRADLHRILADQVPAQDIHLGKRCTAFTEDQDGVRIDFADGTTRHADLLIGADGVHSLVRQATAGPGHPQFAGTAAIRGVVPIEQVPDLPAQDMYVWTGPTSRMLACPVNAGRALAFVAVIPDTDTTHDSWSRHSDPTELRTAFTHWEPAVRHLVAAATQTGHWSLYDREPLTHWSTPRTTLLGDAAHPMLPHYGQGASQAIEDAITLATCLTGHTNNPDQITTALRHYQNLRLDHTTRVRQETLTGGSQRLTTNPHTQTPQNPNNEITTMIQDTSWIQHHDIQHTTTP